jgi:hypothetical protein
MTALVRRTERPARIDDYVDMSGKIGDAARAGRASTPASAPIVVDGRVCEVVSAGGGPQIQLPPDAESRLSKSRSSWPLRSRIAKLRAFSGYARQILVSYHGVRNGRATYRCTGGRMTRRTAPSEIEEPHSGPAYGRRRCSSRACPGQLRSRERSMD